jgi:hypothetical protein
MNALNYKKITLSLIAAWFVLAVAGSASHVFANSRGFGLSVAIASAIPLVLFLLWFATSTAFRQFAMSLNPQVLTSVQSWRAIGFIFVLLEAHGLLPAIFAWPAGFGDMAVGMTAAFVAWKTANSAHRGAFIRWQIFGIADLVTAVTLGSTAGLIRPQGVSAGLMTVMPLSLIPTFLVPLFLMLHIICIAQARKWPSVRKGDQAMPGRLQQSAG